jgi:hypothetical protein
MIARYFHRRNEEGGHALAGGSMLRQLATAENSYVRDDGGEIVVVPNGVYVEASDGGYPETDDFVAVVYKGQHGFLAKRHVRLWSPSWIQMAGKGFLIPILEVNWYNFHWTVRAPDLRVTCNHAAAGPVRFLSPKKSAFLQAHVEGHTYFALALGMPICERQGVQTCAPQHITLAFTSAMDECDRQKMLKRCQEVVDRFHVEDACGLPVMLTLRHVSLLSGPSRLQVRRPLVSFTEAEVTDNYSEGLLWAIPPARDFESVEDVLALRGRDCARLEEAERLAFELELHERAHPECHRTNGVYTLCMDHGLGGCLHMRLLVYFLTELISHSGICYFQASREGAQDRPPIVTAVEIAHVSISGTWMYSCIYASLGRNCRIHGWPAPPTPRQLPNSIPPPPSRGADNCEVDLGQNGENLHKRVFGLGS